MADRNFRLAMASSEYDKKNVSALRKLAAGKISGAAKLRKIDLVRALALWDVKQQEARDVEDAVATAKERAAQAAKGKGKCAVCRSRRIDRKTQGRDSTMCEPCFDYAGWENTHSDEDHEAILAIEARNRTDEDHDKVAACPVCQGKNPADEPKPTRKPKSKASKTNGTSKPKAGKVSKADRFLADAKLAGWKTRKEVAQEGRLEIVTAHTAGGEYIRIQWFDNACLNTGTTHKRADGKVVKVRNASAARKLLDA